MLNFLKPFATNRIAIINILCWHFIKYFSIKFFLICHHWQKISSSIVLEFVLYKPFNNTHRCIKSYYATHFLPFKYQKNTFQKTYYIELNERMLPYKWWIYVSASLLILDLFILVKDKEKALKWPFVEQFQKSKK